MSEQTEFRGWAKVEVMGHQSHIGFVQTEVYGAAVLFRIDQPALPEEKGVTLGAGEYAADGRWLSPGTVVDCAAQEGVSVLVGAGSIYRIIPCTEAAALKAIRSSVRRPLMVVSLHGDTPDEVFEVVGDMPNNLANPHAFLVTRLKPGAFRY
jgi:hypothetical protein